MTTKLQLTGREYLVLKEFGTRPDKWMTSMDLVPFVRVDPVSRSKGINRLYKEKHWLDKRQEQGEKPEYRINRAGLEVFKFNRTREVEEIMSEAAAEYETAHEVSHETFKEDLPVREPTTAEQILDLVRKLEHEAKPRQVDRLEEKLLLLNNLCAILKEASADLLREIAEDLEND